MTGWFSVARASFSSSLFLLSAVGVITTPGIVVILAIAAVAAHALTGYANVLRNRPSPQILILFGLLVLWAMATTLWALDAARAGQAAVKILALCLLGLLLPRATEALQSRDRQQAMKSVVIGWGLGFAVLLAGYAYTSLTGHALWGRYVGEPLTTLSRGEVVLMMLAWPAAGVLWQWRKTIVLATVVLALAVTLLALRSHAALIGLLSGATAFATVLLFKRRGLLFLAGSVALGAIAAPAVVSLLPSGDTLFRKIGFVVPSAVHRAYTWHFTVDRILEHPIRGWGMEASRRIPGGNAIIVPDTKDLRDPGGPVWQEAPGQSLMQRSEYMPLHPHSIPLQIWLELGLPGAMLMGWLILLVYLGPARGRPVGWPDAFRAGAATSYIVVGGLSFGAWQNWWIALGWLTAALTAMVTIQERSAEGPVAPRSA